MSETRALLLTDIVDSTELASRLGDDEAAALNAAHDRLARDLLRVWRGREIDKTDGMLMLFDTAADAAGYALSYHQALAGLSVPMKARAGLHVGAVVLRSNDAEDVARGAKPLEVHGIAKPTAARVMALALGGQTLLTAEAREGLAEPALRVQSHGHWKLKGVPEPLELFELGGEGASFAPMPDTSKAYRVIREGDLWLPLRDIRYSLPAERDAFVGRIEPLRELARHFEAGARLVSILGIGGTGKTRLATYFAWAQLGEYPGGVWFCDLSQARDVNGIASAVAQGLEVPLGKEDPVEQLAYAIAGRGSCLVILDNFEQVARHAEETLGRWLDRAAHAKFMVTTREVLGLPGEATLALAPLPVVDAVDLFTKRALAAKYDFAPNEEDRTAIPQLVKLLDGLPLAVELAAARVRVMQPRMLLSRMDQRFKLLSVTGGRQDRQATLRTTFDWSWDLLSPAEKSALAQLSVFDGGFDIESAEAVLDLSGDDAMHWAVDILQSLVDKSFVRSVSAGRFDLLASVQDYAAEHLRTPGRFDGSGPEAVAAAHMRHLEYFASITDQEATAERCIELGNLVTACRRACVAGKAGLAVKTLERAWRALELRGPFQVALSLAELVGALPELALGERARAERVLGAAQYEVGNSTEAKRHFEAALRTSDDAITAQLYVDLAKIEAGEGNFEASRSNSSRALAAARSVKGRLVECAALNGLGSACVDLGGFDEARTHYSNALLIAREVGDRHWEGGLLGNLGNVHAALGRFEDARADYEDALGTAREIGDRRWEGNALSNLGLLNFEKGCPGEALPQFEAALQIAREIGHRRLEGTALCSLGIAHQALEQTAPAQANFEAAISVAQAMGDRQTQGQALGYLGLMLAKQGQFDTARVHLDEGAKMLRAISARVDLGLLLCASAEAELLAGDVRAAQQAIDESAAIAAEIGAELDTDSEFAIALVRVRQLMAQATPSE